MNQKLLKFTAFLLLLTGIASSCNPECPPDCPDGYPDEYPQNISFTEYSLNETSCQWQNLPYDEKVIIINSSEELEKYISCAEGSYPVIDFSKHSLLLASGKTGYGICEITAKSLQQLSPDKYELHIEITLNDAADIKEWATALIIKKLKGENDVELKVATEVVETEIILSVAVTDQRIIDFFNECGYINMAIMTGSLDCFFTTLHWAEDTCLMINTIDEFRDAYECTGNLPEIDFDNYTLIIGKVRMGAGGYYVSEQKIIKVCTLVLSVEVDYNEDEGQPAVFCVIYYWGLYPKLPNKPFYVEYKPRYL